MEWYRYEQYSDLERTSIGVVDSRFVVRVHAATFFLFSLLVSLKLYVVGDSKNMMVVFCNDGLVEKLLNCIYQTSEKD